MVIKYKYFNEAEFQYAQNLIETNPFEAEIRFKEYLGKYPNDYYARSYYVLLLVRIGKINQAECEYNYIVNKTSSNKDFSQSDKRVNGFLYIMALAKAKILACQERYQELLEFYHNNIKLFDNRGDTTLLSYYCRNKLGLITSIDTNAPYRFLQVTDYNEERFLEHIKKHQAFYNEHEEEPNSSQFSIDFPIQKIIQEIKKYIPSNKSICLGMFDDAYYFKFDNCGHINSKSTNYFKVMVFHNTQNFITMHPTNNCENLPFIDLNYIILNDENIKVKKISQIDKFNKKFNRG